MYLSVDLGTTGCRSIIFDDNLTQIADAYEEYGLITPKEGYTEQDAELWWELTLKTAKLAILKAGFSGREISSISISSQGITIVPVDENVTPLSNAISWLDVRAVDETEKIKKDFGKNEIFVHTGKPLEPCYTLPKLLWIKENQEEIYNKAYKFLMPMDFLIAKFTGNFVTDHSMASGTLMYDIENFCWSKKILDFYKIPEAKLPKILWSGERAGFVREDIRKELGLSNTCVVSVGAQDQKCAALGAGLDEKVMTISLGTAGAITKKWNTLDTKGKQSVGWCGYTEKGTFVTEGVINTAGTCLRWVRDLMFSNENYKTIDEEAKDAIENGSSLMFYPYLGGPSAPDFYENSQGVFYGMTLSTKRGSFAAAVMEGVAFQIKILLETMDAYSNVEKIILFGGGAKGALWCQIIADITGLEILIPSTFEAAGAGAAVLAARALGKDIGSLSISKSFKPSSKKDYYEKKYELYRSIEKKLWA